VTEIKVKEINRRIFLVIMRAKKLYVAKHAERAADRAIAWGPLLEHQVANSVPMASTQATPTQSGAGTGLTSRTTPQIKARMQAQVAVSSSFDSRSDFGIL
jgi:hypothetical protein